MISKFIESYFKRTIPLEKYGMVPEHSFFLAISSCLISLLPEKFYDKVEEGSIILKKSQTFCFHNNGIIIDGDETSPMQTDVVILATGYKSDQKLKSIFVSPSFQELAVGSPTTTIPLYRSVNIYLVYRLYT